MRLRRLTLAACAAALIAAGPGDAPVADAAMRGDAAAVRALLAQGADVNAAQGDGMTALHWAAELGAADVATAALAAGAAVDARTRNAGYTPLHLASRQGRVDLVRILLSGGADPTLPTLSGAATALHLAAQSGSAATVAALLEKGAQANTRESEWGQTPLTFATALGRVDVMKVLLAHGADVGTTDRVVELAGFASVDDDARKARDRVLAAFRASHGDPVGWIPTPEEEQAAVRAAIQVQRSVASAAAQPSDEPAAPSANAEDVGGFAGSVGKWGGLTPLLYAAREGLADAATALLDAGADVNQVSAGDRTSPLLMAAINGNYDLALALLRRGANPNLAADNGATPLFAVINDYWAPKSRYPQQHADMLQKASYLETMEALLKAGASPNARLERHPWYLEYTFSQLTIDTKGATPFWRAAYATDVDAMRLLVKYGADPTIPTMKQGGGRRGGGGGGTDPSGLPPVPNGGPGVYPIHAAAGVGYGEGYAGNYHRHVPDGWLPAMRYLIEELHADVNARDMNGYTALHHAAARGDNAVIQYLVDHGADVTAVSRRGQTTVDMANGPVQRIQPFPETIALLESLGREEQPPLRIVLRRVGRSVLAVAMLSLTGCFVYVPAQMETVPLGQAVRLRLSGTASTELSEVSPDAGRVVRGTLVRRDSDKLYLRVPLSQSAGFETQAITQEVGFIPADILEVELRRRSGSRSALLVAGTGAMAAVVIGVIIQGHGGRDDDTVEPPDEIRIPLGR